MLAAKEEVQAGIAHTSAQLKAWMNLGLPDIEYKGEDSEGEGTAQTGANSDMKATLTILPKARTQPRIRKEASPAKIAGADTIGGKAPTEIGLTGKDKELAELRRDAEKWRKAAASKQQNI